MLFVVFLMEKGNKKLFKKRNIGLDNINPDNNFDEDDPDTLVC